MIGQLAKKGKSYRAAAEYLMHGSHGVAPNRGHLIDTNLTGASPRDWAKEIAAYRKLRPSLGKAVFHASLSVADGDRDLSDDDWRGIATTYLDGMGFGGCPFVAVLHRDTGRPHIHLLALRIKPDGSVVSDAKDYQRSETLVRQIERDWRLNAVATPRSLQKKKEMTMDHPENDNKPSYNRKQRAYLESLLEKQVAEAEARLTGRPAATEAAPSLECAEGKARQRREYKRQLLETAYQHAVDDVFAAQVRYFRHNGDTLAIHFNDGGRIQDAGQKVVAYGMTDMAAAERLIEMALLKGFESVVLRGNDAFLRQAMTLAKQKGLGVSPLDDHQLAIWHSIRDDGRGGPPAPAVSPPPVRRKGLDSLDGPGNVGRRLRERRATEDGDPPASPMRPGFPRRPL